MSFNTSASDGFIIEENADYLTAQGSATGTVEDGKTYIRIGQMKETGPTNFTIWRSFLYFDFSELPADAVVISAKLQLYGGGDMATDFNLTIRRDVDQTLPTDPLDTGDFDIDHYDEDGGSLNTAYFSGVWQDIPLNSTGINWIVPAGTLKLALISSEDINKSEPTGTDRAHFNSANAGENIPRLVVTYAAEGYPTVTTQAATNVGKTYCTANGTLTDGGVATEWGFEYGLSETPTWIITQTGRIGEQSFQVGISGLEPETTYYYRAYCTNSYGTAYGGWVSFTTGTLATYGLYEEDNTATICFYISEDDGMTWGQKHGPYTEDQADIEITKLLVRGSGKKKIKFESDVLTGISASVMCKLDLKAR